MHRAPLAILFAALLAGTVAVAGCSPFARPEMPDAASAANVSSSKQAKHVMDRFLDAAQGGRAAKVKTVGDEKLVCASKALRRADDVTVISVAEDESASSETSITVFDVKCDLVYPEGSALQSGLHVLRVVVVRTPDGWRIEDDPGI